jgi:hypothetical protein
MMTFASGVGQREFVLLAGSTRLRSLAVVANNFE